MSHSSGRASSNLSGTSRGGRVTSGYTAPRSTHETYHPGGYGISEGLRRARRPYAVKNAVTGTCIIGFAVGAYYYSIRQVRPDDAPVSPPSSSLTSSSGSSASSAVSSIFQGGEDRTPSPAAMPIGPLGSLAGLRSQKEGEQFPATQAQRDELRAQILIAQGRLSRP